MALAFCRKFKNFINNYSEVQVKVREATSNDSWGPTGALLAELSDLTYNKIALSEMLAVLWKRLGDQGKKWKHVHKSLIVFDYLVKTGSEKVLQHCKQSLPLFKLLQGFVYVDKKGQDLGENVRKKAIQFVSLLEDEEQLNIERERALKAKEIFGQPRSEFTSSSPVCRRNTFVSLTETKKELPIPPNISFPERKISFRKGSVASNLTERRKSPGEQFDLSSAAKSLKRSPRGSLPITPRLTSDMASQLQGKKSSRFDQTWFSNLISPVLDRKNASQSPNRDIKLPSHTTATKTFATQFKDSPVLLRKKIQETSNAINSAAFPTSRRGSPFSPPIDMWYTSSSFRNQESAISSNLFDHHRSSFDAVTRYSFNLSGNVTDSKTKQHNSESLGIADASLIDLDNPLDKASSRLIAVTSYGNPFLPSSQDEPVQTSVYQHVPPTFSTLHSMYGNTIPSSPTPSEQNIPTEFPTSPSYRPPPSIPPPPLPLSYLNLSPPFSPTLDSN